MPTAKQDPNNRNTDAEKDAPTASGADSPSRMSSGYGSAEDGSMDAGHRYTGNDDEKPEVDGDTYSATERRTATPTSGLNAPEDDDAGTMEARKR